MAQPRARTRRLRPRRLGGGSAVDLARRLGRGGGDARDRRRPHGRAHDRGARDDLGGQRIRARPAGRDLLPGAAACRPAPRGPRRRREPRRRDADLGRDQAARGAPAARPSSICSRSAARAFPPGTPPRRARSGSRSCSRCARCAGASPLTRVAAGAALALVVAVALSRVYLGVHYPSRRDRRRPPRHGLGGVRRALRARAGSIEHAERERRRALGAGGSRRADVSALVAALGPRRRRRARRDPRSAGHGLRRAGRPAGGHRPLHDDRLPASATRCSAPRGCSCSAPTPRSRR